MDSDFIEELTQTLKRRRSNYRSANEQNKLEQLMKLDRSQKFTCWETLNWSPYGSEKFRIYVHEEILEWIVQVINEVILTEHVRGTVEEVDHHNLDGQVYLITIYCVNWSDRIYAEVEFAINVIKRRLTYRMMWKTKPTFFLRIDSKFKDRKEKIMNALQELNLLDCFTTTTLDVNWMYIPKIEVYEFFENVVEDQINEINSMFRNDWQSKESIYICDQFEWHIKLGQYIEVDKVAMDMCVEEWRRCDLLKHFPVENILNLDLANKDYRDPYYNVYFDRYVDILLKKSIPQLYRDHDDDKHPFLLGILSSHIENYFISRFHNKISVVRDLNRFEDEIGPSYDLPVAQMGQIKYLTRNKPHPNDLFKTNCYEITYKISNYRHFSDSLFRSLLNKWNTRQTYEIRFDRDFIFKYQSDQQFPLQHVRDNNWLNVEKEIEIVLKNCDESRVETLVEFVNYLLTLFSKETQLDHKVTINFKNCMLDDYAFLENVRNTSIGHISFERMEISSLQIRTLSCALANRKITLIDCKNITDTNIMTLLENIDYDDLTVKGETSCTPLIYYLLSEHLMDKEDVDAIEAERVIYRDDIRWEGWHDTLDFCEFAEIDDQIVFVNTAYNAVEDLYYLVTGVEKDESIDTSNNMFME